MDTTSPANVRCCHSISNTVIKVVMAVLREHAVGGQLALEDVERILALVGRGTVALDESFRVQEQRCIKEHSRPKGNVGARSNPFQRLMVRPFESLLVGERPAFPRPLLVNYFQFLIEAMGRDRDELECDCRAIIQALLVVHGNNLTWDHFYSDPRTLKLLHTALRRISQVLSTPVGQTIWNAHLSLPAGSVPAPTVTQTNQLRQALLETHRGLSA